MADVQVTFGANIGELTDATKRSSAAIADLADQVKSKFASIGDTITTAAAAFGIGFGADALKNWIAGEAALGEQIENAAAKLGTTAQQASQLSGIATLTGTAFEALQTNMERFNLNLGEAAVPTSRVAAGLKALGLSAKEFQGIPIPQQLELLAEAASKFADGGSKTAAIMALMGRSGAEMIPYLDKGREGIEDLQEALDRTGATMSNDVAAAFAKTDEDIHEMSLAWQGLSNTIFSAIGPAVDSLIRLVSETTEAFTNAAGQAGAVRTALDGLAIGARIVASAFTAVLGIAESTMSLLVTAVEEAVAAIAGLGTVVKDVWNRNFGAIASDARATWATMKSDATQFASDQVAIATNTAKEIAKTLTYSSQADAMSSAMAKLRASMGGAVAEAKTDFSQIGIAAGGAGLNIDKLREAFASLNKPQAGTMQIGGDKGAQEALDAQIAGLNREIDAYKAAEKLKQEMIESEVKTKTLSAAQGATAVKAALDDELSSVTAVYDKETTLLQGQPMKLAGILKQEQDLQQQYAEAVQKLQIQAAEQSAQVWQKAFQEINSSFESQISGLIKGTTSWQKAFQNIFDSLTTDAIKFFVNLALQAAENETKQILSNNSIVAAIIAGYASITAASGASVATQAAQSIATGATQVASDAGRVYAGVAAFLAPELGPAALGVASGDAATVLGIGLAGFDKGAWEVPSDMIAQIHAGEKVIPAGPPAAALEALANGGAGGGDIHNHQHNWHVNVNGAQDPSAVADAIESQVRRIGKAFARATGTKMPRFA